MVRITAVALVAILIVPAALAQEPDPGVLGDTLRPILDPAVGEAVPPAERTTGDDLHSEEFHITVDVLASNIEYQILGILFGGGKIQADLRGDLALDFYAVSAERLDQAIKAFVGNDNASLNGTFGVPTNRVALTAEEVRLIGSGMLLAAFQAQQEALAVEYVTALLPGLRILGLEINWKNTQPLSELTGALANPTEYSPGIPSLRDPPLRIEVRVDLQYLDRLSLYEILRAAWATEDGNATAVPEPENPQKAENEALKRSIRENQTLPFAQRNAFQVLGISQLLNLAVQPGWTLDVRFTVPKGFTIEGVTDELERTDDKQTAGYFLDGNGRENADSAAGIVTISNRFLVTTVLFAAVVLIGGIVRAVVELGTMAYYRKRSESQDVVGPS